MKLGSVRVYQSRNYKLRFLAEALFVSPALIDNAPAISCAQANLGCEDAKIAKLTRISRGPRLEAARKLPGALETPHHPPSLLAATHPPFVNQWQKFTGPRHEPSPISSEGFAAFYRLRETAKRANPGEPKGN